jgi:hypothetical protein
MAPKRPEPTMKEILGSIRAIIRGEPPSFLHSTPPEEKRELKPPVKPRRGLSPGLLLMAVVALAITIAAAVKNMK